MWTIAKGFIVDVFVWLYESLVGVVNAAFAWWKSTFNYLQTSFWQNYNWARDAWLEWIGALKNTIADWFGVSFQNILSYLMDLAKDNGVDFDFMDVQTGFDSFKSLFMELNWILPLSTVFGIVTTAYAAVLTIRVLRWIIRLVPFVG